MRISRRHVFLLPLLLVVSASLRAQVPSAEFNIFLPNDDGYDAPGIRSLVDALRPVGHIVVAAPATEQSGRGHGLTLREPVLLSE